jgi:septum formation protein
MTSLIPWLEKFKNGEIELILGSASKPRKTVVQQLGIPFRVMASSFAEDLEKSAFKDDFTEYPLATSREKSKDLISKNGQVSKPTVLVTCDTVVLRDKQHIIEKPEDEEHAVELLESLSGIEHEVVTGVVVSLILPDRLEQIEFKVITIVGFAQLTAEVIRAYVASGEPFNKAGGYGIQGLGELLIDYVRGSFTNVIGIPVREVLGAIGELLSLHVS